MADKEKYLSDLESTMDKYKTKISKLDSSLKDFTSGNKTHLTSKRDELKDKYKQAEGIYKKLKSSSEENFEEIKESSSEIFDNLKDAVSEFSNLFNMGQLMQAKDEIAEYGREKVSDIEDCIKKRPLASAGWAMGIGFLLGTILTRSK